MNCPVPHLQRRPVEADRADVVLAAAVGAAAHLDLDRTGQRIAERLDSTRGALYETLHDARRKLRAALSERGFDLHGRDPEEER